MSLILSDIHLSVSEEGVIYRSGKQVNVYDNGNGYKTFYHCRKMHYVHRIVCLAYHGDGGDKKQVNHKNGIKSDNRPQNLEWVTCSENILHAFNVLKRKHGTPQLGRSGDKHHNSKSVNQIDKETGEVIKTHGSTHEAAKAIGVHQSAITAAIFNRNRMKYCKGYKWAYA